MILKECVAQLKNDAVILCQTDTIPGLICDPRSKIAVEKLREIKKRLPEKHFILNLHTEDILHHYVREVPAHAYELIEYSTIPLTIIFPGAIGLPQHVISKEETVAIRIVKSGFFGKLLESWNAPLVSSSANISGDITPTKMEEVAPEVLLAVDYTVNLPVPEKASFKASRIIKLDLNGRISIIRH